mmetsp:Transcript_27218/g.76749  ORF Transcript_27218/g.76749 Transcript_27218/m.76749 type:complete len:151 (-) Transcript_27218:37-489(-)
MGTPRWLGRRPVGSLAPASSMASASRTTTTAAVTNGWAMFWHWVDVFNTTRGECLNLSFWAILDEAMSAYKPWKTTLGGLPNISFVQCKPKPLGTSLKCVTDVATGAMTYLEIQEGRDPMRLKDKAKEFGVTVARTYQLAKGSTKEGCHR